MIDVVFYEMIHMLSSVSVSELQEIKKKWMLELKRNNIGTGIRLVCASMCDEIITHKQQK